MCRRSCLQPVYAVQDAECQTVLTIHGPACICPGPCDVGDQDFVVNYLLHRDAELNEPIFFRVHHGLRGSASPVLTATGFVNARGQFSTPHRIHTP